MRSIRCNGRCAAASGCKCATTSGGSFDGGFYTPDRKARFVAPERPAPREATSKAFPFRLNTGRVRDQWHTMTRSA